MDRSFVKGELLSLLTSHGIVPWYAEEHVHSADEWERTILAALRASEWFLVVVSHSALESEWVRAETHWACENRRGRIIPVLIEDVDVAELHLKLSRLQYVDYRHGLETARGALLSAWGITPANDVKDEQPTGGRMKRSSCPNTNQNLELDDMIIQSGSFHSGFGNSAWQLLSGRGDRPFEERVDFSQSFREPPEVIVALSGMDTDCNANLRVTVEAREIDRNGFTIMFRTWADSKVCGIWVQWVAYGS